MKALVLLGATSNMPYLTPEEIPEGDDCRPLSIPASTDWLAIVSGALTELTKPYNWQQEGLVTVDEAVERMQAMVDVYYDGGCQSCEINDTPIFRVNMVGEVEQWDGNDWVAPFGDYTYPNPIVREEPTPEENICLASTNAVNALSQLYEAVTDQYNTEVDPLLGIAAFALAAGTALAFAVGAPIVGAILLFAELPFTVFYNIIEQVGSDFWDADFTEKLICLLITCAQEDAGVVTFDMECVIDQLGNHTDIFDPTATEIKLFGQVDYMLRTIGQQGLNQAGSTTAITSADCSFCEEEPCCYYWDDQGAPSIIGDYTIRTWSDNLTPDVQFHGIDIEYQLNPNGGAVLVDAVVNLYLNTVLVESWNVTNVHDTLHWDGDLLGKDLFYIDVRSNYLGGSNYPDLTRVTFTYICDDVTFVGGTPCP